MAAMSLNSFAAIDMALHPEVDSAVDEVVNEFVVNDNNDSCVDINLENLELGAGVKKKSARSRLH